MLSIELEQKLIHPLYADTEWESLTQRFLDNGKEKATLSFEYKTLDGRYIQCPLAITYDGTDKDFNEKYHHRLATFNYNKYYEKIKEKYNLNDGDCIAILTKIRDQIYFMFMRENL